jgi:hypothetical protein
VQTPKNRCHDSDDSFPAFIHDGDDDITVLLLFAIRWLWTLLASGTQKVSRQIMSVKFHVAIAKDETGGYPSQPKFLQVVLVHSLVSLRDFRHVRKPVQNLLLRARINIGSLHRLSGR